MVHGLRWDHKNRIGYERWTQDFDLVGGLEHQFYCPIYWVSFIIPIDSYFSEGWPNHQPVIFDPQLYWENSVITPCPGGPGALKLPVRDHPTSTCPEPFDCLLLFFSFLFTWFSFSCIYIYNVYVYIYIQTYVFSCIICICMYIYIYVYI